jgi:hypothetical protein
LLAGIISLNFEGVFMMYRNFLAAGSCAATLALTACGSSANLSIKSVDLTTSQVSADTYINMDAIINIGSLKLPGVEVPVFNPKTMQPIGSLSLSPLADGTNEVTLSVDFTQVSTLDPTLGTTLPNGREIPSELAMATGTTLVGVPVMTTSRVYVGGDVENDLYAGAAIVIPAFNSVMANVPIPLNIFFSFPFTAQLSGTGGMFTSPVANQNGIAVFVKKTAATATTPATTQLVVTSSTQNQVAQAQATVASGNSELNQLDMSTLYHLNNLFKTNTTVEVK